MAAKPKHARTSRKKPKGRKAKSSRKREPKTLYELLKPFIGIVKDGPSDVAENHTLYARGLKKWK